MKINYYTKTKDRNIGDFDEIDCRFDEQKTSLNGSDSRLGKKPVRRQHRAKQMGLIRLLKRIDWIKVFVWAFCGFLVYLVVKG
jgi:hypothetical protein